MIPVTTFAGRRVAVFGLGGSGLSTAQALLAGGAEVAAWDDGEAGRTSASAASIALVDLRSADWSTFAALVLSPGVPLSHPKPHWTVGAAKAAGVEIIGDVELFSRERAKLAPDAAFIAITGTNGKSTTTALIAHVLRNLGRDVQMGGNIGVPVLSLEPLSADRIYVVECSSYQIDLAPLLEPTVGLLLNISPDHLDRHGDLQHYADIKERLIEPAQTAVIGVDDELSRAVAERARERGQSLLEISVAGQPVSDGVVADADGRLWRRGATATPVAELAGIENLRGRHNAQNAAAAVGVLSILGLQPTEIQSGLQTFPGLAHRLQVIGRVGPVTFLNDSKATNAVSTGHALAAFERDIYWIVGGLAKEGGIDGLAQEFSRVAKAYLIGASMDDFAVTLENKVAIELCGTLEVAVAAAARDAAVSSANQPVVVLSPAAASFDQFASFVERGEVFRQLVAALDGAVMSQGEAG